MLNGEGCRINRKRMQRLKRKMGIVALVALARIRAHLSQYLVVREQSSKGLSGSPFFGCGGI
jgi:hypothetical protein